MHKQKVIHEKQKQDKVIGNYLEQVKSKNQFLKKVEEKATSSLHLMKRNQSLSLMGAKGLISPQAADEDF